MGFFAIARLPQGCGEVACDPHLLQAQSGSMTRWKNIWCNCGLIAQVEPGCFSRKGIDITIQLCLPWEMLVLHIIILMGIEVMRNYGDSVLCCDAHGSLKDIILGELKLQLDPGVSSCESVQWELDCLGKLPHGGVVWHFSVWSGWTAEHLLLPFRLLPFRLLRNHRIRVGATREGCLPHRLCCVCRHMSWFYGGKIFNPGRPLLGCMVEPSDANTTWLAARLMVNACMSGVGCILPKHAIMLGVVFSRTP